MLSSGAKMGEVREGDADRLAPGVPVESSGIYLSALGEIETVHPPVDGGY